jgi:phosphoribosylglycinamide formyltransferase-1
MNIFPKSFIDKFCGKILNVHPSYLPWNWPKWKIDDILKEVLYTKKWFWASIHFINEKIDEWEIILAEKIEILENDDEISLKEKVQKIEQKIYPKAIKIVLQKKQYFN